jgi:hypothetical protein
LRNSALRDDLLFEIYGTQRGPNQIAEEEKEFQMFLVKRDPKSLKIVGEPTEVYTYVVHRDDGSYANLEERANLHPQYWLSFIEMEEGYYSYIIDRE